MEEQVKREGVVIKEARRYGKTVMVRNALEKWIAENHPDATAIVVKMDGTTYTIRGTKTEEATNEDGR